VSCGDFVLICGRDHRLSGRSDWIELYFVWRERTPSELMKLSIDSIWLKYHFDHWLKIKKFCFRKM